MELTDVAQRIFKRHWALILILGILGALAPLVLQQIKGPTYIGTARFVIGTDPRTGTTQDSTSLSDTALGLATNPALMATVMKQTHVQRDPLLLAPNITVTPVGTSGVLDLAVTDSDARASAALANGLATEIVKERTATLLGNTQQLINQTDVQIRLVNARIAAIENASHGYMTPGDAAALALRHADALAVRASLSTQREQLSQLLVTTPAPQLLNASEKTGIEDTSTLLPEIAVGALLGLIVGIAVAATREATHPTYGREALARRFGVPVLGRLSHAPSAGMQLADPWLANYVKVAAEEAGVRAVQVVAAGRRPVDVTGLARNLSGSGIDVSALVLPGRQRRRCHAGGGAASRRRHRRRGPRGDQEQVPAPARAAPPGHAAAGAGHHHLPRPARARCPRSGHRGGARGRAAGRTAGRSGAQVGAPRRIRLLRPGHGLATRRPRSRCSGPPSSGHRAPALVPHGRGPA